MVDLDEVRRLIEAALPGSSVVVTDMTGGSDHLAVHVTAPEFVGCTLIEQHKLIHAALREKMAPVSSEIHALQIKTAVPQA